MDTYIVSVYLDRAVICFDIKILFEHKKYKPYIYYYRFGAEGFIFAC
jgi:hypothetical protein